MQKKIVTYYLLFMLTAIIAAEVRSQVYEPGSEKIGIFSDRSLYIAGEKINFTALVKESEDYLPVELSRVLYCELVTPSGSKVVGGKFPVEHFKSIGCIQIPEETISGIYYLKAYTRFMRNDSPENYHYIPIKIVNPKKNEVLAEYMEGDRPDSLKNRHVRPQDQAHYSVATDKDTYFPRENVRLEIETPMGASHPEHLCLTVVPEGSIDDLMVKYDDTMYTALNGLYFPETRGVSLSGSVINSSNGNPIAGIKVHLSIISDRDIMVVRTDSSGRFFFTLPDHKGNRDIFLCTEEMPGVTTTIYIDNDFCTRSLSLPAPSFSLDQEEREMAYHMAVNLELADFFPALDVGPETGPVEPAAPFYGKPTQVLVLEKYIDLPTLEDYFSELAISVKVRKSQGRKHFRFSSEQADMAIYEPLVLIDWVAVENMEKILAMDPRNIDRVELVNAPYVKGSITYGGIVSFVSKNNDFAGIDLPASGTFINYSFLEECQWDATPENLPENIPDTRNTVHWDPDLALDENGTATITFPAPDTPGSYTIVLKEMITGSEIRKDFIVIK